MSPGVGHRTGQAAVPLPGSRAARGRQQPQLLLGGEVALMSQGGPGLLWHEAAVYKAGEDAGTRLFVPFLETDSLLSTSYPYHKSECSTHQLPCSGS